MDTTCSIILAAGKGTRLKSDRPKVMHEILGLPLIYYSLALACDISESIIAVVGHGRAMVIRYLESFHVNIVIQEPQLGTGHAVLMARKALAEAHAENLLILPGDMPLIKKESLQGLLDAFHSAGADMGVLTARIEDPSGYGRIVRSKGGKIKRIVEHNDATPGEKKIDEINTGIYIINKEFLLRAVECICPDNAKGEFYLTDVAAMAGAIVSFMTTDPNEAHGINSRAQLAFGQAMMQHRVNNALMEAGVTIHDPLTTWISPAATIGNDVEIWPNCHILGRSRIGPGTQIMPNVWVHDSIIGNRSSIGMGSIIEQAALEEGRIIAPYTRLC